jgi:hypothetical protein
MYGENGPKELRFLLESLLRGAEAVQQNINELRRVQEQIKDLLDDPMLCTALPETEMGGERRRSLSHLRDFTRDAVHLTVIDPYMYSGKLSEADAHVDDFSNCTCLDKNANLKSLHVIYNPGTVTKKIRSKIKKRVRDAGKSFSEKETDKIHDRIWIKNHSAAVVTGTSLGGIGNKLSFILELPDDDLRELKRFLKDQSLLPKGS